MKKNISNYPNMDEVKEKHLREIKTLESEYSRNIHHLENLHERQKDITSRIQLILLKCI